MADELSVKEAAYELDASQQCVWTLLKRGEFPNAYRRGGQGRWRIPRADIDSAKQRWRTSSSERNQTLT